MYKAIFLDIDDTVFNFRKCSESALKETFSMMKIEYNKNVFDSFSEIDDGLWTRQKRNQLTVDEVLNVRFIHLAEKLGLDYDCHQAKMYFGNLLGEQYIMEPGIENVLDELSGDYKIYAASNGILKMQDNRLQLSGLKKHFTDLFVSDDIGYAKPDINFFTESLNRSNLTTSNVLMVGDSLISDIEGASVAGIDSCWYNPYGLKNSSEVKMDYEINKLKGLLKILSL